MPNIAKKFLQAVGVEIQARTDLTAEQKSQLIDQIRQAREREAPPTIVIIGESGVGKSTTINALFNAGQKVSAVRATTMQPKGLLVDIDAAADSLTISASKGVLQVFDMPGIGDDMSTYQAYREIYLEVMPLADVILWVHPAEDRTIAGVQQALAELIGQRMPHLADRLVFGLNKADTIQPNRWNTFANVPSEEQVRNLKEREVDFSARMKQTLPQWRGQAQAYSAERRYGLTSLFKHLVYAMPPERRWVLEERMDLADFFELVDRNILRNAHELAKQQEKPRRDSATLSDPVAYIQSLSDQEYADLVRDRSAFVKMLRGEGR